MNPEFSTLAAPAKPPTGRPPDGGRSHALNTSTIVTSFRDKLMSGKVAPPPRPRVDLFATKLAKIEYEKNNHLLPKLFIESSVISELEAPWEDALIVKLLGKNIGFIAMRNKLQSLWKPEGDMDIKDLGNGFFMVKIDSDMNRQLVMDGGP